MTLEMMPLVCKGLKQARVETYVFSGRMSDSFPHKEGKPSCTCWKGYCFLPEHEEMYL